MPNRPFVILLILAFSLLATPLNAQAPLSRYFTIQDGMSMTEVANVTEDELGYIWSVSTNGGLSRYDGFKFYNYPRSGPDEIKFYSVSNDRINRAYAANQGKGEYKNFAYLIGDKIFPLNTNGLPTKWIATDVDADLCLYAADTLRFFNPATGEPTRYLVLPVELRGGAVSRISWIEEGQYHVYWSLPEGGYQLYDWQVKTAHKLVHEFKAGEASLNLPNGNWIVADKKRGTAILLNSSFEKLRDLPGYPLKQNLFKFHHLSTGCYLSYRTKRESPYNDELVHIYQIAPNEPHKLSLAGQYVMPSANAYFFTITQNGYLYAGGHAGIIQMVLGTKAFVDTDPNVIKSLHALAQFPDNTIYAGGYGTGFSRSIGSHVERLSRPPFSADISVMPGSLRDIDGSLVFLTEIRPTTGLIKIFPDNTLESLPLQTDICENESINNRVPGFYMIKANWPGPTGSKEQKAIISLSGCDQGAGKPTGRIGVFEMPITKDSKKEYLGYDQGIRTRNVLTTTQDKGGRLWFGHGTGVGVYDPTSDQGITWLKEKPDDPTAISMLVDDHDRLWLGAIGGLFYIEGASTLPLSNSLHLRQRQKKAELLDLDDSFVTGLLRRGDTLFVSHSKGLSILDISKNPSRPPAMTFPLHRYLGAGEQNAIMMDNDERTLWVGSDNGFVGIDFRAILRGRRMQSEGEIVVSGDVTPSVTTDGNTYTFPPTHRSLEIGYRLPPRDQINDRTRADILLLSNTGDTLYQAYYLPPGKMERIPVLPPGTHEAILTTYADNVRQESIHRYIRMRPMLRENWWFYPGIATVLALLIIGWLRARNIRIKAALERKTLENQVNAAKLEASTLRRESDRLQVSTLSSAVNPHFISNAITWLQSAYFVGRPQEMMDEMSENLAGTIRTMFTHTADGRASHSLAEEVELVKRYLNTVNIQYDNKYTFTVPEGRELKKFSTYQVLLMQIQLHAENAVEHGLRNREGARQIIVSLHEVPEGVEIHIEDDGAGVSAVHELQQGGHIEEGRGTKIMSQLQETFNKYNTVHLETRRESPIFTVPQGEGIGTRVVVRIPRHYTYDLKDFDS